MRANHTTRIHSKNISLCNCRLSMRSAPSKVWNSGMYEFMTEKSLRRADKAKRSLCLPAFVCLFVSHLPISITTVSPLFTVINVDALPLFSTTQVSKLWSLCSHWDPSKQTIEEWKVCAAYQLHGSGGVLRWGKLNKFSFLLSFKKLVAKLSCATTTTTIIIITIMIITIIMVLIIIVIIIIFSWRLADWGDYRSTPVNSNHEICFNFGGKETYPGKNL